MHPLLLALIFAAATPDAARPCAGDAEVVRTAHVMGTELRVRVWGSDRRCALAAAEAALAEVERLDGVLSTWRPDAEMAAVNGAPPGVAVAPGPELAGLLECAGRWVEETGGWFDPAVGALVDAWALRGAGRIPDRAALEAARAAAGWVDVRDGVLARPSAAWWIDTGGFGKGAALRSAGDVLEARGVERAVLDFGGQLLVLGAAVPVAVAHPARRSEAAAWLRVADASVATTSASERWVESAGIRLGHVVDPRSGRPVRAWGSVTVVAADALAADAVSTALFVAGPEAALHWAAGHPEFGVLVLQDAGGRISARWSDSLSRWLVAPGVGEAAGSRGQENETGAVQ